VRRPSEDDLGLVYRGVGSSRGFGGHHGVLEVTAWFHVVIAELERLDEAALAVATGDHVALDVLRELVEGEPLLDLLPARGRADERALRRCAVGVSELTSVGVAAYAVGTRSDDDAVARRVVAFAARRIAGMNLALDAAKRARAGWWTRRHYATRFAALSPFAIGEHGHGDGDSHTQDVGPHTHDEGQGHTHDEGAACPCVDHERLTSAVARHLFAVVALAHEEGEQTDEQESIDGSLYERVCDTLDVAPAVLAPPTSTAAALPPPVLVAFQPPPPAAPGSDDVLRVEPCSSQLAIGEPLAVWVSVRRAAGGDEPPAPVDVVVAAGGREVRVRVPASTGEALASISSSEEPGSVTVTASCSIAGATIHATPATVDYVVQHVPCNPGEGGSWQLAPVEAHEVVSGCTAANELDTAASRLRGQASEAFTKAVNAGVAGTILCFERTEFGDCILEAKRQVRRCVEKRDQGYNRCTEERDEGYNRCDASRDEGYSRCCDWAPCSWFCDAWVWVSHIVCTVWTWVSHIVCVAWEWVKNIVCVAWAWVESVVCLAWELIKLIACIVVNIVLGIIWLIIGVVLLLIAVAIAAIARIIRWICWLFGTRQRVEVSSRLKVVGIHAALLRTGKVLLMAYDEGVYPTDADHPADFSSVADSDKGLCAVWDPVTGIANYRHLGRNLFCAHHSFLPDGRLLIASGQFPLPLLLKQLLPPVLLAPGADRDVHVFDPVSESFQRLPDMALGRWYPTCATLPDGRVFIASGTNGYATEAGLGRGIQNTWEIADGSGPAGSPFGTGFRWFHLYPFVHLLTTGQLVTHAKRTTRLFDPATSAWMRVAPAVPAVDGIGATNWPFSRTGPGPGTSVLLPLRPRQHDGRWGYPAGRVMILGGGGAEGEPEPNITNEAHDLHADTPATRTVEILDLEDPASAEWRWASPMANGRVMPDSILLPDATVLVLGGGRYGKSGGLLAHFASTDRHGEPDKGALDPVLTPELFDPETGTWRPLCRKPVGRLYHTTALLLADARVLVAGHDGALNMKPYDRSRYELEIFSPPYLFNDDGSPATRPMIGSAPTSLSYGERFEVAVEAGPGGLREACLIRPSALTHQINTEQRYVGLVPAAPGVFIAPPDANVAPPGWYLLFVVNRAGTPSLGHWLQLG
jgi:hypothetical protein